MSEKTSSVCPDCGLALPADAPGGHCPACLLGSTLSGPIGEGEDTVFFNSQRLIEAGKQIGDYQVIRKLGQGGMGEVWEAEQSSTGRRVALKMLKQHLDSQKARDRFFREGRLAASINHPNSVYVFGTEEVDGVPIILMELVVGGSLQDRIRQDGPMSVEEGVDAILQVITGLEAAEKTGILHRDVKPSNCFVESDGSVKVGDYGLSISTQGRGDGDPMSTSQALGTPAFASPEQLRGGELSVRSDIYSVAGTLFYLLTGRTVFEGRDMAAVIAAVMGSDPPLAHEVTSSIPFELAQLIGRCLAKNPGERLQSYAELRAALIPYSSNAFASANLWQRSLAGGMDLFVVGFFASLVRLMLDDVSWSELSGDVVTPVYAWTLLNGLITVGFFSIAEWRFGTTPGKWLCGLWVRDQKRQFPSLRSALVRAAVFVVATKMYWLLDRFGWIPQTGVEVMRAAPYAVMAILVAKSLANYLLMLIPFVSARRTNGFAAWQDLLSGTRVVARPCDEERPWLEMLPDVPVRTEGREMIGPYHVLRPLGTNEAGDWLLAYDTHLLRRVWLRLQPEGSREEKASRRTGRPGRLRWLGSGTAKFEHERFEWNAYEGVDGKSLASLDEPQPWGAVRFWLLDLADELNKAEADGTLPSVLSVDRVWITAQGRAKLLDFSAPGLKRKRVQAMEDVGESNPTPNQFLSAVAKVALHGGRGEPDARADVTCSPEVRGFLGRLKDESSLSDSVEKLRRFVRRFARVSVARRLAIVAACAFIPVTSVMWQVHSSLQWQVWKWRYPKVMEMGSLLRMRTFQRESEKRMGSVAEIPDERYAVYVSQRFGSLISNPEFWKTRPARRFLDVEQREFAEQAVRKHPNPGPRQFADAEQSLESFLNLQRSRYPLFGFLVEIGFFLDVMLFSVGLPALLAAMVCREGLILRAAGVVVVDSNGFPAHRLRLIGRALIIWLPLAVLVFWWKFQFRSHWDFAGLYLFLGAVSPFLPRRGIADLLARTWLVPRQ